jgi:phage host-nuclease inhibitor protein Gam
MHTGYPEQNNSERIGQLIKRLAELAREYQASLEEDQIFEVRKNIRLQMKALQSEIESLEKQHSRAN